MFADARFIVSSWWRFRCYKPQKITAASVMRWYLQFERHDRRAVRRLVHHIRYLPERQFSQILLRLHIRLVERLRAHGYKKKQIVFMSFDDAGSSSAAMLNSLRDIAHLENQGFTLLHSGDITKIGEVTYHIGEGVLVYVDDFVGSGRQLIRNIKAVRPLVQGNFIELAMAVCVCEEALVDLETLGIESVEDLRHLKAERPLHDEGDSLESYEKKRLLEICADMAPPHGLGFRRMATMVVLFRNAPNNTPMILRGNKGQAPFVGLIPRTTDLPVPREVFYQDPT